ncbi:MAG: class II aldolase and adducin N-terminal domain-containing protein [Rhodospirillales bacterium]
MSLAAAQPLDRSDPHLEARRDLACAFRWAVRLNLHEAVANHFSLAVNDSGTRFLMNPNQRHFGRLRASDLLLLDADDRTTMAAPDAPDPSAWGLHGSIHRACPHARCVLHLHPIYATVLCSLAESHLPPIDQNTATFYKRHIVDQDFGGLALEAEGTRCAGILKANPTAKVMVMGNHGLLVLGETVADAFNRLYYFERAAETYIKALWTGQPLRRMSEALAEKTARELEDYPDQAERHFAELRAILDEDEPTYRD